MYKSTRARQWWAEVSTLMDTADFGFKGDTARLEPSPKRVYALEMIQI
jgi:hypothetical protein